ncbi:hypothetical protein [Planctomicrobium sp. SH664]|uniref:hypothetical protein n=1 Tax=Planctomicrobium sp. SH664 TaxID=3448125 RepID=UPI003F5C3327
MPTSPGSEIRRAILLGQNTAWSTESGLTIERWLITRPDGVPLPALRYRPASPSLYVHEKGKQASSGEGKSHVSAERLARNGATVLAVDLRGTCETAPRSGSRQEKFHGGEGKLATIAYVLGQSLVGNRTEDLMVCARWMKNQEGAAPSARPLTLVAAGSVSVPALHAAALESKLFGDVQLLNALPTSAAIIASANATKGQFDNAVHGALRCYDLTDLSRLLGNRLKLVSVENSHESLRTRCCLPCPHSNRFVR